MSIKDQTLDNYMIPMIDRSAVSCPLSTHDIGDASSTILLSPDRFLNKEYLLSGPEPLTNEEQAKVNGIIQQLI